MGPKRNPRPRRTSASSPPTQSFCRCDQPDARIDTHRDAAHLDRLYCNEAFGVEGYRCQRTGVRWLLVHGTDARGEAIYSWRAIYPDQRPPKEALRGRAVEVGYLDPETRSARTFDAVIEDCPGTIGTIEQDEPVEGLHLCWIGVFPTWDGQPSLQADAYLALPGADALALLAQHEHVAAAVIPPHLANEPTGHGNDGGRFVAYVRLVREARVPGQRDR